MGLTWNAHAQDLDTVPKIQIAMVLDVSGSMNGLINQAQTQIWKIVNFVSQLEKNNVKPLLEMAVISYGNAMLEERDHIFIASKFEQEIDEVAESLSQLSVGGGNEFCGRALEVTLDSLEWSKKKEDLKIIIIAGNEGFDQGPVFYKNILQRISKNDIYVNTIFCGTQKNGIQQLWDDAAFHGNGEYGNIDQDMKLENMETPYDAKIINLYQLYRTTMLFYGAEGLKKSAQLNQYDEEYVDNRNIFFRDRIIFKILYEKKDARVDLVELFEKNPQVLSAIAEEDFPPELQGKRLADRRKILIQSMQKRRTVENALRLYEQKINDFIEIKIGKEKMEKTLGAVLPHILAKQAKAKNFNIAPNR